MDKSAMALSLWLVPIPLCAQWLNLATPGIPRTADSKPNLNAPAPYTSEGKPDFSGLWRPGPTPYAHYAVDVIQDPKDESIFLPAAEALFRKHLSDFRRDNPFSHCLPGGPLNMLMPGLHRIIQSPTVVALLYEFGTFHRQVFLDGRQMPKDPNPTWLGYSVGHWDGDTLVVETAGFNDRTWLDMAGHPHSEQLRVTERFRRGDFGRLIVDVAYSDPGAYEKPWAAKREFQYRADTELLEYVCAENERDKAHLVGRNSDELKNAVKVAPEILSKYVGTYERHIPRGPQELKIAVEDGALTLSVADGPARPLAALSQTVFYSLGARFEFNVNNKGDVTHLLMVDGSGDWPADRKK